MLGEVFERFVAKSPLSVMVRAALDISFALYAASGKTLSSSS
jgi:hypothetical protein